MEDLQQRKEIPEIFNQSNLDDIADHFGLPTLRFIKSPNAGIITENAVLESEDGTLYFAKYYHEEDLDKHAGTYRAAELVAQNPDLPVVLPLLPKDSAYTVTVNDRSLVLFPYIPHREEPPQNEAEELSLASSMALNLGRIHTTTIPEDEPLLSTIERWQPEQEETRIAELEQLTREISQKTELSAYDSLALQVVTDKLKLLQNLPPAPKLNPEQSICHGDFHGYNVLYNEDMEVVAALDWDNAGLADANIDFLNTFQSQVISGRFNTFQTDRKKIASLFVQSYQQGRGEKINLTQLRDAYRIYMHERIGTTWPMSQHYFKNHTQYDEQLERVYKKSLEYANRYEEIWEFIEDAVRSTNEQS